MGTGRVRNGAVFYWATKEASALSNWKQEALRLYFDEHKTWGEIIARLQGNFPGKHADQIRDAIRGVIRRDPRYKGQAKDTPEYKASNGWQNGQYESDRLVEICEADEITPELILRLHGLKPEMWEATSYRNNYWHSQVKGGRRLVMYQSKVTARPRADELTFADVERWFAGKDFAPAKPPTIPARFDPDGETLEITTPDLHSGLRSWAPETGASYDVDIALDRFKAAIRDILARCEGRRFKCIMLALLGDLLHADNDLQTTTKGTFQQTDGRMARVFSKTLDALIEVVDWLGAIAPVDVIYTRGNHDATTGWMLIKALEQTYRRDDNVSVDVSPDPQKHRLIGNVLIGFVHGDMPPKNLAGWLQVRARQMDKPVRFVEVHSGHMHAQKVREYIQTDDAEGVVVRTMPTICLSSTWEHQQGYDGVTRTMVSFVWSDTRGLREMWYSNM
jgi:hypothetical protein